MLRRCSGRSGRGGGDGDGPLARSCLMSAATRPPLCEPEASPEPPPWKRARRDQEEAPVAGGGSGGSPPYLPQELISNILSRLPVRTLYGCRSVCRTWHALITDPHFVAEQMDRSKAEERPCLLAWPHSASETVYQLGSFMIQHPPIGGCPTCFYAKSLVSVGGRSCRGLCEWQLKLLNELDFVLSPAADW